jgi:hypothetical protein
LSPRATSTRVAPGNFGILANPSELNPDLGMEVLDFMLGDESLSRTLPRLRHPFIVASALLWLTTNA